MQRHLETSANNYGGTEHQEKMEMNMGREKKASLWISLKDISEIRASNETDDEFHLEVTPFK